MFQRCAAIGVLLAVSSCELLSGDDALIQAKITHQLNGLQIALEKYLEDKPTHEAVPAVTVEGNGDEAGHPVDTAAEGQVANPSDSGTTSVSIVAIVDSLLLVPAAEGEELDPADEDAAMRRERLVRQAIGNSLVENRLLKMIQPTSQQREKTRGDLIATNSSVLATQDAIAAGADIGVDHLIWAVIEREGESVHVVAQRVDNGVMVFDDNLIGWDIFESQSSSEEE